MIQQIYLRYKITTQQYSYIDNFIQLARLLTA